MDNELKELKSVLRSLVVSSPSQVDVRSLLRDYRQMVGAPIPLAKYGYREPLVFLKERCNDCFIFHGEPNNPTLTLIVPETLKHIDKFVQKQKSNPSVKFKGKRRSVPGTITHPPKTEQGVDLIVRTFQKLATTAQDKNCTTNNHNGQTQNCLEKNSDVTNHNNQTRESVEVNHHTRVSPEHDRNHNCHIKSSPESRKDRKYRPIKKSSEVKKVTSYRPIMKSPEHANTLTKHPIRKSDTEPNNTVKTESSNAVHNFLKKRMSLYNSSQYLDTASSVNGRRSSLDDDSGRQTSSSNSSKKSQALEELKIEVVELVASHPEGVWCADLLSLYRERHGRELNFGRFGMTSIISLVCTLDSLLSISRPDDTGDWLLRPALPAVETRVPGRPRACRRPVRHDHVDPEDALPGIDFDPDVFPVDCMHFMESIPSVSLGAVEPGALLDVMVGEVYSPSHFWLIRLGELYHIAMEQIMDEMTEYYSMGEGRDRFLATGAVRLGHYCSSVFDRDWHRSLIVKIIDSETVKVRHVDYGTVDVVSTRALKPLLRRWAQLPAQAVRARLAGVRPGAAGRRWPHAASARLLQRVRDARLVASVVAVDREEDILEVFLVNTSTDQDDDISADLIRSGHADPRSDSCVRTSECYLFPKFAALESGATPNFAEISEYLQNGISLDYVDDYRRHVPDCLPPAAPLAEPGPSTASESELSEPETPEPQPPVAVVNRIPLLPPAISLPSNNERLDSEAKERPGSEPALAKPSPRTAIPRPATPEPTPVPEPTTAPECKPEPAAVSEPETAASRPAASPGVTLSVSECETFQLLSRVDPAAAHWFMVGALGRAAPHLSAQLNISAPEFRPAPPEFRPAPPEFRPAPPEFRPAPPAQFRPAPPEFRPAPPAQFRPNAAAPEFRPRLLRSPQLVQYAPQPRFAPQFPVRAQYAPHYGHFVPPNGFMPPPGFGPC